MNTTLRRLVFFILATSCAALYARPTYVTASHPAFVIINEIVGTVGDAVCLPPPGVSPHNYSPTPADYYKAQTAMALFYISESFNGWAENLGAKRKIELLSMTPASFRIEMKTGLHGNDLDSGSTDPYFWTDPLAVKAIVPIIADTLSMLDPDNAAIYRKNAERFIKRLELLHRQVENISAGVKSKSVFLFHPSFLYFLKRYGMIYAGSLEPSPEKELKPKYLESFSKKAANSGAKAIFTERQFSGGPLKTIAETAGIQIYVLDPIGGGEGLKKYSDIILYNARILKRALE